MDTKVPAQTEATTVRMPQFDRDDDRKYSLETVYLSLAAAIQRRHGRKAAAQFREAMTKVFNNHQPHHYEYVHSVLESRINLEIQETIREMNAVANAYEMPRNRKR